MPGSSHHRRGATASPLVLSPTRHPRRAVITGRWYVRSGTRNERFGYVRITRRLQTTPWRVASYLQTTGSRRMAEGFAYANETIG
jgi:hypothetical protein